MAVTAEGLFKASKVVPTDFGVEVVSPDVTDYETQKALAISFIEEEVLPDAMSEVSVPVMKASGGHDLPLPDGVILRRYPSFSASQVSALNSSLQSLYDGAVISYGRSEINARLASDSTEYDKDEDQDRKTGDEKLKKLIEALGDIINGRPQSSGGGLSSGRPATIGLKTEFVF